MNQKLARRPFAVSDLHPEVRGQFSALTEALVWAYQTDRTQFRFEPFEGFRTADRQNHLLTEGTTIERERGRACINSGSLWTTFPAPCGVSATTRAGSGTGPNPNTTTGRFSPSWRRRRACARLLAGTNPMLNTRSGKT